MDEKTAKDLEYMVSPIAFQLETAIRNKISEKDIPFDKEGFDFLGLGIVKHLASASLELSDVFYKVNIKSNILAEMLIGFTKFFQEKNTKFLIKISYEATIPGNIIIRELIADIDPYVYDSYLVEYEPKENIVIPEVLIN